MRTQLETASRDADLRIASARADLVRAIRQAAADGMTQVEIGQAIGRSQPEVSRLLHFHGTTPLAMTLRRNRDEVIRLVKDAGGANVRVFGSVATGAEHGESDVDLLFTMKRPLSLMRLGALELRLSELLGVEVDLVPDNALKPTLRDRAIAEAVLL